MGGTAVANVYLSSTFEDLKDYRAAVHEALSKMEHNVVAMEHYVATDTRPVEKCLRDVEACDIYVGIFAWRYGYVPTDNNPQQLSITELEYRRAGDAGKPRLLFLVDRSAPWSPTFMDSVTGDGEGGARIRRLRSELEDSRLVSHFRSPEELGKLVSISVSNTTSKRPIQAVALRRYATAVQPWIRQGLPARLEYDVPIGRYSSAEAILSSDDPDAFVSDLASLVREVDVLLLHGRGGSGKSVLLRRLALEQLEQGEPYILLDLSLLTGLVAEGTEIPRLDPTDLFNRILLCSPQPLRRSDIERWPQPITLIVDGLNELSSAGAVESAQTHIFSALHSARADYPGLKIIVADRLNARPEAERYGYTRLCLQPLAAESVRALVPGYDDLPRPTREILQLPFFLNLWRGSVQGQHMSKALLLRQALLTTGGLGDDEIARLADVAYASYAQGSQYFDLHAIQPMAERLISAGFLVLRRSTTEGPRTPSALVRFSHELFHDYLAASLVANKEVAWNEDAFDALSLRAQSIESMQLALEQVPIEQRQDFLIRIYDWSYKTAATCLAEHQRYNPAETLPPEIQTAIVGSIADRQFDVFPHTRAAAAKMLRRLPRALRQGFLITDDSVTEESIRLLVGRVPSEHNWFLQWQRAFTRAKGSKASQEDLEGVLSPNSLVGWGSANAMRRMDVPPELWQRALGVLLALKNSVDQRSKRWRIAHMLGRSSDEDAIEELFELLTTDEYHWVRYGAVRSLIELAWRLDAPRQDIFSRLTALVPTLSELCLYELSRCITVGHHDPIWMKASKPLQDALEAARQADKAQSTYNPE
jgi:Domain of unknown function (DUF4062)/NACHT domain